MRKNVWTQKYKEQSG